MTTSVAIVGGGAVGLSTAWHLVERGITDVIVLEATELAAGSSSRSAGFIETQYVDPLDIELRARSMRTFRRLQRDHELEIKEIGYLRLAPDAETLEAFDGSAALQHELGIEDAEALDADGVRRLVPLLRGDGIAVAYGGRATAGSTVPPIASSSPGWPRRAGHRSGWVSRSSGRRRHRPVGGSRPRTTRSSATSS